MASQQTVQDILESMDPGQRRAMYDGLMQQALQGIPLQPGELALIAHGALNDPDTEPTMGLNQFIAKLEAKEEINPNSTQAKEMRDFAHEADKVYSDEFANSLIAAAATGLIAGSTSLALRGTSQAFIAGVPKGTSFLDDVLRQGPTGIKALRTATNVGKSGLGRVPGRGMISGMSTGRKTLLAGGALAGVAAIFMGMGEERGRQASEVKPQEEQILRKIALNAGYSEEEVNEAITELSEGLQPSTDAGRLILEMSMRRNPSAFMVDPGTGQSVNVNPDEIAAESAQTVTGNVPTDPGIVGSLSPDLAAMIGTLDPEVAGVLTQALGVLGQDGDEILPINDQILGDITIPTSPEYQFGVSGGATRGPDGEITPPGMPRLTAPRDIQVIDTRLVSGRLSGTEGETVTRPEVAVPPGGQINPKVFTEVGQNRTYLSLIVSSAQRIGVPVEVLYGVLAHESGFMANAVSADGSEVGLAQIDYQAEGLKRERALDPQFAIYWMAQRLALFENTYGSWAGAIAALFDPLEGASIRDTGEFTENGKNAQAYTTAILQAAMKSGLGPVQFDPRDLPDTAEAAAAGPVIPPFEKPDPDTLIAFAKQTYTELLGREPTDQELQREVDKLNGLYRQDYDAQVAGIRGKSVEGVDIESSFTESISGMPEAEFHGDVQETRGMSEFMGDIANVLASI